MLYFAIFCLFRRSFHPKALYQTVNKIIAFQLIANHSKDFIKILFSGLPKPQNSLFFGFKADRKLAEIHQNKKISSPKKCKQKQDN